MVERIKGDVHQDASLDDDLIKRSIVSAIERYKYTKFWFNEASSTFDTEDGTFQYGRESSSGAGDYYPIYMLRPEIVRVTISSTLQVLRQVSPEEIRSRRVSSSVTGYPSVWGWYQEELWLDPVPNGAHTISLDYTEDIGSLNYAWSGSAWSYTTRDGSTALTDAHTSSWFTDAEELIRNRAEWDLYSTVYDNVESAAMAKDREMRALRRLAGETTGFQASAPRQPDW